MALSGPEVSVYEDLMRFKPEGLSANGWAVLAGVSRTVWADMKRHDNPSRRTLDKLLAVTEYSLAEFEALRVGGPAAQPTGFDRGVGLGDRAASAWRGAPLPPISLLAAAPAQTGDGADSIDCAALDRSRPIADLARPASLATDRAAFAIAMIDDSMWPRFRAGRNLIVSPGAPVAPGDDVLATVGQTGSGHELVLVGELVRRAGTTIELRQFNPDRIVRVMLAAGFTMAKIVGQAF